MCRNRFVGNKGCFLFNISSELLWGKYSRQHRISTDISLHFDCLNGAVGPVYENDKINNTLCVYLAAENKPHNGLHTAAGGLFSPKVPSIILCVQALLLMEYRYQTGRGRRVDSALTGKTRTLCGLLHEKSAVRIYHID